MTHDQIVAALQRGYQLDDARESRRGCYPIRKPAPRTTAQADAGRSAASRQAGPDRVRRRLRHLRRWNRERSRQLLARLVDELPAPERVEPFAFLEDELLPLRITLVEPAAFVLACVQAAWGPYGPQN